MGKPTSPRICSIKGCSNVGTIQFTPTLCICNDCNKTLKANEPAVNIFARMLNLPIYPPSEHEPSLYDEDDVEIVGMSDIFSIIEAKTDTETARKVTAEALGVCKTALEKWMTGDIT